jgi:hypothetical protein
MKNRKQLERRTFLQDRYDILIKKLNEGEASFAELTELDDIVNRSAYIRNQVLSQMQGIDDSSDDKTTKELPVEFVTPPENLMEKVKQFLGNIFTLKFTNRRSSFNFKNACFAV